MDLNSAFAMVKNVYGAQIVQEIVDDIIDKLEAKAAATANPLDDMVVAAIRKVSGIADDVGGDED